MSEIHPGILLLASSNNNNKQPSSRLILGAGLLFAMLMCSSAGVAFAILTNRWGVPSCLAASWRLWCAEAVQVWPFLWTFRKEQIRHTHDLQIRSITWQHDLALVSEPSGSGDETYHHPKSTFSHQIRGVMEDDTPPLTQDNTDSIYIKFKKALPWLVVSGFFLGVHFSSWVYSLRHTSLTHSMLWVSMGPILIHGTHWIWYSCHGWVVLVLLTAGWTTLSSSLQPPPKRPSSWETWGTLMGLVGALLLLLDISPETNNDTNNHNEFQNVPQPSLKGDAAAFCGAAAVSIYLYIGGQMRSWMPLWLYAFPVVGSAMVTSLILAILLQEESVAISMTGFGPNSVFGFLNPKYFWLSLYLGAGPGVGGHTMLNALLKYMSPLTISTAMLSEPIFGSLIGYAFGLQPIPGGWTFLGGGILLAGLLLVIYSSQDDDDDEDDPTNNVGPPSETRNPSKLPSPHLQEEETVVLVDTHRQIPQNGTEHAVDVNCKTNSQYGSCLAPPPPHS
eukprot:scaffold36052_cov51-Attheya_sp.AAC.3